MQMADDILCSFLLAALMSTFSMTLQGARPGEDNVNS